jgi:hypothetical protein
MRPGGRRLHGVGRDDRDESAWANRDAAFDEEFTQAFDGAANAFLRGIVTDAEGCRE